MRTLLLADESITVQRVIALTFAEEPIRVVAVGDGQQALEKMAAQQPDIVLAGTALPQINGYDLAKFMRGKAELKKVPVLLLSGAFESVDQARVAASGANGVLEKPVEPTVVISRVKELLGMKTEDAPAPAGRVASAPKASAPAGAGERQLPAAAPPRAVTSTRGPSRWDQLRDQSLEPNARSVENPSTRADDYLDTLDAAFDSLDRQLSGRPPKEPSAKAPRNPSGPIGHAAGAPDPRSPGRTPPPAVSSAAGNPVFEVDDEWFGPGESQARADARAGRRELVDDLSAPELRSAATPAPADSVYEVDDAWFADDDRARAAKLVEQQELAKEMGIHEVELPDVPPSIDAPAPASDLDFDFGIEDLGKVPEVSASAAEGRSGGTPPKLARDAASEGGPQVPEPPKVQEAAKVPEAPKVPDIAQPAAAAPVVTLPPPPVIPAPPSPVTPVAPVASASARSESGELRRDVTGAASGRVGGPVAPAAPSAPARGVADDFAALLAFEQGLSSEPPQPVKPEVTDEMLDEIASRVVAPPPVVTDEMLDQIASRVVPAPPLAPVVTEQMLDQIASRVVPPPPLEPVVTDAMLSQIAARVVPPPPLEPVVTDAMLSQIAARVVPPPPLEPVVTSEMLDRIAARVVPPPPVAPVVTDAMLNDIAARVVPAAPVVTDAMLDQIAARVTPPAPLAPQITDAMLGDIAKRVPQVAPEVTPAIVEQIAGQVAQQLQASALGDQLREAISAAVKETVRSVVSETSERLVREEIERIKSRKA